MKMSKTALLIGRFLFQVVIGAGMFVLVGGVAWGLSEVTEFLQAHRAPWHVWYGTELLAEAVFAVDAFCFLAFILTEAYMLVRLMVRNAREDGHGGGNNGAQK